MADTWLVAGASGQLGFDLLRLPRSHGRVIVGLDLPDLDITAAASVAAALDEHRPSVVINAAAYTAVDAAETDEEAALRVNGFGPRVLAEGCALRPGTRLVQISTDYVFDGAATAPYAEDAEPAPQGAYGRTKLVGEQAVLEELPEASYVVRTAWLYGAGGANFVRTMLALEAARDTVDVVDDQIGQPTWAHDLAEQIDALVSSEAPAGIYHGTNAGQASWCGLAREVFRLVGADPGRVRATTTAAFPRPAPRPAWSVLGHRRWADVGLASMRPWQQALAEAMPTLRDQP